MSQTTADPASVPLENGDRLTRAEFERRYEAMPDLKKAELIQGVVHMPSPVRQRQHGGPHFCFVTWLGVYAAGTPGVEGGDNSSLRVSDFDEPQPDAHLMILAEKGGQARLDAEGYIVGMPEWLGEVSASSVSVDLNAKLESYAEHGVQEYVVWRVLEHGISWFVRQGNDLIEMPPDADGIYRSRVMPGLWLDAAALIAGDMSRVLAVVQAGLASPEHQAFLARLGA